MSVKQQQAADAAPLHSHLALLLDLLGVFLVELDEARFAMDVQQLVELALQGLRITMLGMLDEDDHRPGVRRCYRALN
jgi:hypothetical protein